MKSCGPLEASLRTKLVEVTSRFKGLGLMDRVLEELWTGVHNAVQEAVTKTIPKKKKCKKAKCLSEDTLQIAEKRREAKGKGEKEIYLNAEFQRIARREKKAFLNDQCKEIEGRETTVGKTRDLFKKIRDVKGTFHAKMGTIRTEMEWTKQQQKKRLRRCDKNTQKNCTKKGLNDLDNHNGVVTHLEPDIMEFEVKWALGSITTNKLVKVMEFQLSYFKS